MKNYISKNKYTNCKKNELSEIPGSHIFIRYKLILHKVLTFLILYYLTNMINCVRIRIGFTGEACSEDLVLECDEYFTHQPSDAYSETGSIKTSLQQNIHDKSYNCAINLTKNINVADQCRACSLKIKLKRRIEPVDYMQASHLLNNLQKKEYQMKKEHRMKISDNFSLKNQTASKYVEGGLTSKFDKSYLIFDYSSKYIIRSKTLDNYLYSGYDDLTIDIESITKDQINRDLFSFMLHSLRLCKNTNFSILKEEDKIKYIGLLCDLFVYSESNALEIMYKNLFSFLVAYKTIVCESPAFQTFGLDLKRIKQIFLPFLGVLYDEIEIKLDFILNEILFSKKDENFKCNFLYTDTFGGMKIRITPECLIIMKLSDSFKNEVLLPWFISFFNINGIKISFDNTYYSECINPDLYYSCLDKVDLLTSKNLSDYNIFSVFDFLIKTEIKFLDLECIFISKTVIDYISRLSYLETLILVKCVFPQHCWFLIEFYKFYASLKILNIIGIPLSTNFINNLISLQLEELDLSYCKIIDKSNHDKLNGISSILKIIKIDSSSLSHKIIDFFMKSSCLRTLSMKNIDFTKFSNKETNFSAWNKYFHSLNISGSKLGKQFLDFFSTDLYSENLYLENIHCQTDAHRILEQESLFRCTKYLSCTMIFNTWNLYDILKNYCFLDSLKLYDRSNYLMNWSEYDLFHSRILKALDLSQNMLSRHTLDFIGTFENLEELNLSRCGLNSGSFYFLRCIKKPFLLKKIDLSDNELNTFDILALSQFKNIKYLRISFDNSVLLKYYEMNGILNFEKLEVLSLVHTTIDSYILSFLISQDSLIILKFEDCSISNSGLSEEVTYRLKHLVKLSLSKTSIDPEAMKIIHTYIKIGIQCVFIK
ncbi:hypothetical protein CWI36_0166p0030 [Hamiltosporidium magnivora]|uniref:Leucine-rich repeat-containing protein n=1 Tax=Hamiltosporidium magnivora TaxID=148818 RepID=A0A4Q9LJ51_9MICR|nr:hypothetical protein CWI36_0166p0030 [Hamiltosporidium magnivora]